MVSLPNPAELEHIKRTCPQQQLVLILLSVQLKFELFVSVTGLDRTLL